MSCGQQSVTRWQAGADQLPRARRARARVRPGRSASPGPGASLHAEEDRGYGAIQSTRPQTVGYGLNDSPAGLAAWVVEKWRGWTDSGGDLDATISRDFLLTVVTLYWATQTIASSMRDYADNRWLAAELGPADAVTVPTAVAVFAHQFIDDGTPPREWAGSGLHLPTNEPSGPGAAVIGMAGVRRSGGA